MTEDEEPFCAICRGVLESDSYHKLSECNHQFHAECIIQWFRIGGNICPLCADEGANANCRDTSNNGHHYRCFGGHELTDARKFARSKHASAKIKRSWTQLRQAEVDYREHIHQYREWRQSKSVKNILKKNSESRTKRWRLMRRVRKMKCSLVGQCPQIQRLIIIEKRIIKVKEQK